MSAYLLLLLLPAGGIVWSVLYSLQHHVSEWRPLDPDLTKLAGLGPSFRMAIHEPDAARSFLYSVWLYRVRITCLAPWTTRVKKEPEMLETRLQPPTIILRKPLPDDKAEAERILAILAAQSRRWCCTPDAAVEELSSWEVEARLVSAL